MVSQISFVGVGTDLPDLGVAPVMVVAMHVRLDPGLEFGEGGEGVPVVVLVLEDAPERFCTRVVMPPRRQPTVGFRCVQRTYPELRTCTGLRVRC